jgi:hypothetical protein
MIKPSDIENWVLSVIDRQKRKQPCEDSRVEMKAKWPDPSKVARQIAGHANAARGENILWIIGLDEVDGVVGADDTELANWLPEVKKYFNGLFPEVIDLNVPVDDKTVVAILFSTDRAPFVVKNTSFGKPDSGPVELEVPWREGRSTRSARREDLMRILVPISRLPSASFLSGTVDIVRDEWRIDLQLYIAPFNKDRLMIPFHRCQILISVADEKFIIDKNIKLLPPVRVGGAGKIVADSVTIDSTGYEVIIDGPGRLELYAAQQKPIPRNVTIQEITITVKMFIVNSENPLVIESNLTNTNTKRKEVVAEWCFQAK